MGSSPIGRPKTMEGILNKKVSTLAGLLAILIVFSVVGYFILYQLNEITQIRIQAVERQLKAE